MLARFALLEVVELQANRVGADPFETIENARHFTIRNTSWGFDKNCLLNPCSGRSTREACLGDKHDCAGVLESRN